MILAGIVFTSCMDQANEISMPKSNIEYQDEKDFSTLPNKTKSNEVDDSFFYKKNLQKMGEEKDVVNYYYSPDLSHFFKEVNMSIHGEMGDYLSSGTYFDNGNDFSAFYFIHLERNLSPNPVVWLNNEEVLVMSSNISPIDFYRLNVITNKKQEIIMPEKYMNYYSMSFNKQLNKLALTLNYSNLMKVFILDLETNTWEQIDEYKMITTNSSFYNVTWGTDKLFFDSVEFVTEDQEPMFNIKKYDPETGEIEDFKENARIINASPDMKYITYNNHDSKKTEIFNLSTGKTYKTPFSTKLTWHHAKSEFVSTEDDNQLLLGSINENDIHIKKISLEELVDEDRLLYNIEYNGDSITFDIVEMDYIQDEFFTYVYDIKKVYSYKLE
jgi:hypothetical protein